MFNKALFLDRAGRLTEQRFVLNCRCDTPLAFCWCLSHTGHPVGFSPVLHLDEVLTSFSYSFPHLGVFLTQRRREEACMVGPVKSRMEGALGPVVARSDCADRVRASFGWSLSC